MPEDIELEIANIVSSGVLGTGEIDTSVIGDTLDVDQVSVYPGRIYLSRDEGGTVMIYRKGTYAVAGAKSHESLMETVEWMTAKLKKIAVPVDSPKDSLEVDYIVYTTDLGRRLDLEMLAIQLGLEHTEYEPEQFPGLLYRGSEHDCTVLLFASGKVVVTGVQSQKTAKSCLDEILAQIR